MAITPCSALTAPTRMNIVPANEYQPDGGVERCSVRCVSIRLLSVGAGRPRESRCASKEFQMLHHAMPTCPSLSLQRDGVRCASKDAPDGRTPPHEPLRLFPADRHDRRPDDPSRWAHVDCQTKGFSIGVARDVG